MDEGRLHFSYFGMKCRNRMEYLQRKASISERTMTGSFDLYKHLLILADLQEI